MTRVPSLVLVDLDDTLYDWRWARRAGLAAVTTRWPAFSHRPMAARSREYVRLLNEMHDEVVRGRLDPEDARTRRIARLAMYCGFRLSRREAEEASEVYQIAYAAEERAVPGAGEALSRLRARAAIGVVTNHRVEEQRRKLSVIGLATAIDFLVTSEEVGVAKPHPEIFRRALDRAGVPARAAVMIGDSWEADVLGARAAGIRPIWLHRSRGRPRDPSIAQEIAGWRPVDRLLRAVADPRYARTGRGSPRSGASPSKNRPSLRAPRR